MMTLSQMTAQATTPPNIQEEYMHRIVWKQAVMATLNVLILVISARLILLIGVSGAIGLTMLTLANPDPYRLGGLAIYCLVVVLPSIWLAARGR